MKSDDALRLMHQADRARTENRLADAHRDFVAAVQLCRRIGVRRELVRALKGLGQVERDLGHGEEARLLYEEAVALCREQGDPLALAHTVRHLGDTYHDAGRLQLAEPCYREALALYRNHEQALPLDLANAIRPLAILKEHEGDLAVATELWTEVRNLYASVNVQEGFDESSARLARLNRKAP
jgi:tetratricopeptide (TPR) repeat protein